MSYMLARRALVSSQVPSLLLLAGAALSPDAWAESTVLNPGAEAAHQADKAAADSASSSSDSTTDTTSDSTNEKKRRLSTYEMEQIIVEGQPLPEYKDDELIGDYAQPRWTAQRLFSGTRVYVIPKGEVDIEQWFRVQVPKHGGPTTLTAQSEIEFGLPYRFQLDLYLNNKHETGVEDGDSSTGNSVELRWAFADWGRIWGNPALYLEYTSMSGEPDLVEGKLLLGDTLAPGWHWGVNFSCEQQTSGAESTELQFTAGISHSLIDHTLEVGAETRLGWTDEKGSRGDYENDLQIGPSFRFRPVTQMHIDFAPLFGLTKESKAFNGYLIFGWEF